MDFFILPQFFRARCEYARMPGLHYAAVVIARASVNAKSGKERINFYKFFFVIRLTLLKKYSMVSSRCRACYGRHPSIIGIFTFVQPAFESSRFVRRSFDRRPSAPACAQTRTFFVPDYREVTNHGKKEEVHFNQAQKDCGESGPS
ncbi:MAG: hypothetical protein OD817_02395 [Gammaproteobacteria bacterium]